MEEITFPKYEITPLIRQRPLGVSSKKRHLSVIKNFFEFLQQYYEGKSNKFRFNPVKEKIHGIKLKDIDINHTAPLGGIIGKLFVIRFIELKINFLQIYSILAALD